MKLKTNSDECDEGGVNSATEGAEEEYYIDEEVGENESIANDNVEKHYRNQSDDGHAHAD